MGGGFYLHSDHLGSATVTTYGGTSGADRVNYDGWGKVRSGNLPQTTLNYTGQHQPEFIITSIVGQFTLYFNVALVAGLLLASPVIVYHLLAFLAPALEPESLSGQPSYEAEVKLLKALKRSLWFMLPEVVLAFAYFLVLPPSLKFLLNFSEGQFKALPTGENLMASVPK